MQIADLVAKLKEENSANKNSKFEALETHRQLQTIELEVKELRISVSKLFCW